MDRSMDRLFELLSLTWSTDIQVNESGTSIYDFIDLDYQWPRSLFIDIGGLDIDSFLLALADANECEGLGVITIFVLTIRTINFH